MNNESQAFSQFAAQPPAVTPATPAPDPQNPYATPTPAPDPNAAPAWADQLLQTVSGLRSEWDAFKTDLNAPPEPEPTPAPAANQEWVPKTYADVDQRIIERAQEIADQALAERERQAQEAFTAAQQQEHDIEQYLDQQVAQLEANNLIPKSNDPNGKPARAELFGYAYSLGTTNLMSVADTLKTLHSQGMRYDVREGKLVQASGSNAPGAGAPIAGGTPNGSVNQTAQPGPDFFRKYDLDMVAEYAKRAIQ